MKKMLCALLVLHPDQLRNWMASSIAILAHPNNRLFVFALDAKSGRTNNCYRIVVPIS
ncbi:MAG TPA: hypothetical protein VIY49_13355 [Bryobacteraceae bacterium]